MQHVDRLGEAHGVDCAERISVEVVHDFQHAGIAEPFQRLCIGRLATDLRLPQRATDSPPRFLGEAAQVLLAASDPPHRLGLVFTGRLNHVRDLSSIYARSGILSRGLQRRLRSSFVAPECAKRRTIAPVDLEILGIVG